MALTGSTNDFISWNTTPLKEVPEGYGWSEDATIGGKVLYRLYYYNPDKNVYLHDLIDDVKYLLPDGAKYRGYLIAFKLNNLRNPKK